MPSIRWDADKIRGVKENAALYNLDLTRGSIEATPKGGFVVHIGAPLFPLTPDYKHQSRILCRDTTVAEGEFLLALFTLQKLERVTARMGLVHGRDNTWITRTPLTGDEIKEYKARLRHADNVNKYSSELRNVVDRRRAIAQELNLQYLSDTYGVAVPAVAAMPATPADATPLAPNAQHRRGNRK
jgi:hypothetical protein